MNICCYCERALPVGMFLSPRKISRDSFRTKIKKAAIGTKDPAAHAKRMQVAYWEGGLNGAYDVMIRPGGNRLLCNDCAAYRDEAWQFFEKNVRVDLPHMSEKTKEKAPREPRTKPPKLTPAPLPASRKEIAMKEEQNVPVSSNASTKTSASGSGRKAGAAKTGKLSQTQQDLVDSTISILRAMKSAKSAWLAASRADRRKAREALLRAIEDLSGGESEIYKFTL